MILVVTVVLVLGGVYQLNTAFKTWAAAYFGDYLSCLLETGELPTISSTGGDSGLCNEFFKPFSLADGRPLITGIKPSAAVDSGSSGRNSASIKETVGGNKVGGSSGAGQSSSSQMARGGKRQAAGAIKKGNGKMAYTGSTSGSSYGNYGSNGPKKIDVSRKERLDNSFAFDQQREDKQIKRSMGIARRPSGEQQKPPRVNVVRKEVKKSSEEQANTSLGLPDFMRWIIIAGILVALLVFFGNQAMSINKSME